MTLRARITAGAAAMHISLPPDAPEKLAAYLALLDKWNQRMNLTAIRGQDAMLRLHLFDSLAVLPVLPPLHTLADVGSGAGLPGIPLSLARPDLTLTLIESSAKKCAFLRQAKLELALANVHVACTRAEDHTPACPYDGVISRAFASLGNFVRCAGHLIAPSGAVYAMKSRLDQVEQHDIPSGWRIHSCIALATDYLGPEPAQRQLVILNRQDTHWNTACTSLP